MIKQNPLSWHGVQVSAPGAGKTHHMATLRGRLEASLPHHLVDHSFRLLYVIRKRCNLTSTSLAPRLEPDEPSGDSWPTWHRFDGSSDILVTTALAEAQK